MGIQRRPRIRTPIQIANYVSFASHEPNVSIVHFDLSAEWPPTVSWISHFPPSICHGTDRLLCVAAANVPRMKPFRTSLNYEDGKGALTSAFNALMAGVVQELKEKQDRLESQIDG